eukprot:356595_1
MSRWTIDNAPNEELFPLQHYISYRSEPTVWNDFEYLQKVNSSILNLSDIEFYDKYGYLKLKNFFSEETIDFYVAKLMDFINYNTTGYNGNEYMLTEVNSNTIRSIYNIHTNMFYDLVVNNSKLIDIVSLLLGSDVYIQQSRVNLQQAFYGEGFLWHSDFETWHMEDGLPKPRTMSACILLEDSYQFNGGLMVIPGSHKYYLHVIDENQTPNGNWKTSLKGQKYGIPKPKQLEFLFEHSKNNVLNKSYGIEYIGVGSSGTVVLFDSNLIHGSHNNISPKSRYNLFIVYNSIYNKLQEPIVGNGRPEYIAVRDKNWTQSINQLISNNNQH